MSTPVTIGEMKQSGVLRQNTPVLDQSGGQTDNYADVLSCRGRFRHLKGSKSMEQGDIVQNKGYEWVCRFQTGIVLNADTAWVIAGIYYRISDFYKIDEANHFYRFILQSFQ